MSRGRIDPLANQKAARIGVTAVPCLLPVARFVVASQPARARIRVVPTGVFVVT